MGFQNIHNVREDNLVAVQVFPPKQHIGAEDGLKQSIF